MNKQHQATIHYTNLYIKYHAKIFNIAYSKTKCKTDADDITQEVFIRLFEYDQKIKDLPKWINGTLKHVIAEHFRNKKRSEKLESNAEILLNNFAMYRYTPAKDTKFMIADALKNCDSAKITVNKNIFYLVSQYNYSYTQAAKELGVTQKKVRYWYKKIASEMFLYFKSKGLESLKEFTL